MWQNTVKLKTGVAKAKKQIYKMKQYLNNKTLKWLREQVNNKIPEEHAKATIEWFNNPKSR